MKANILNFETPTGQKGNLLHPGSWIPLIIGTFVLLFTFSVGQKLGNVVHSKLPAVNTTPNSPWAPAAPAPAANAASSKMYIG